MNGFVESVHLVDAVLAILAIELIVLSALWLNQGKGVPPAQLLPNLLAGACLVLALRVALAGASWHWYAALLAVAGLANIADLRQRWRNE